MIAKTPAVASSPTVRKLIAKHLIENGVLLLNRTGARVSIKFNPGECVGVMSVDGEEFHVYVSDMKAEQLGCLDASTLMGPKTTPSVIKRVYTFVEV